MSNEKISIINKALEWSYGAVVGDKNPLKNAKQIADEYLTKCKGNKMDAAKTFIKNREKYCFTAGFITGLGGLIALPVSIPASLTALIYLQIQIAAVIASIAGYDLNSDEVKTAIYTCLAGLSAKEITKEFGVKVGNKLAFNVIKCLPGKVILKINSVVGFRLLTKLGEKGFLNLGKIVPVAGGIVSGLLDLFSAKAVGKYSIDMFLEEERSNSGVKP